MDFIWMIIVGLVAGLLARAIKPGNKSFKVEREPQ